ncbi:uncharacterized protein [Typha angustifolia]|uniref:uncharacterized protein n=1 Tax=Typha angustifolia TaxID=59011 RepID=UPI003C2EA7DA
MNITTATVAQDPSSRSFSKQKSFFYPTYYSLKQSVCFLTTFIAILFFIQLHVLRFSYLLPSHHLQNDTKRHNDTNTKNELKILSMLRDSVTFLPLKDLQFANEPMSGQWFISSINDTFEDGETEYLRFPSQASKGRILCLSASDISDGTKNSFALAWPEALPYNAILLPGLTFVSDTYYDYSNIWHGHSAIIPFIAWHQRKECVVPARWVLFHWGELRTKMSTWVQSLAEAAIGTVSIKKSDGGNKIRPACYEEAVVFRHNQGRMSNARKVETYDMMRCKVRSHCNVSKVPRDELGPVQMTLLLRTGARSFKNETEVIRIFEEECRKVNACRFKVQRSDNLTFCDQVKLLSETDILVSSHGAQMTNLIFMDKNSSIMEFFPKGWKELAGSGQYVFRWLADSTGMRHQGIWWDPEGDPCPNKNDGHECFNYYKNGQIGHDKAYFAQWAAKVLNEVKAHKMSVASKSRSQPLQESLSCRCV